MRMKLLMMITTNGDEVTDDDNAQMRMKLLLMIMTNSDKVTNDDNDQ